MDYLKRAHAPITADAWEIIEEEARSALKNTLTGRKFVDTVGPKGWDLSAVALGRVEIEADNSYGIRKVLPVVELRIPFLLDIQELDNLSRGAKDLHLDSLHQAVREAARFEDSAILKGFSPGTISGLEEASELEPLEMQLEAQPFLDGAARAILELQRSFAEGPYALVIDSESFRFLASSQSGYPLLRRVTNLLGGPVLPTDVLQESGFLVSTRGGDFELTLGQDFSIGYDHHDIHKIRFILCETFTFRVLAPNALVKLNLIS
jgi:uncharacterized linocin/CFP29 family protein